MAASQLDSFIFCKEFTGTPLDFFSFFSVVQRFSVKKVLLEISQNSQENTCARTSFLIKLQACNFNKNETLVQVFSCEFCEFSKNIICCRIPLVVASQNCRVQPFRLRYCSSKNLPVPQKYDSFWLRFEQFTWFC